MTTSSLVDFGIDGQYREVSINADRRSPSTREQEMSEAWDTQRQGSASNPSLEVSSRFEGTQQQRHGSFSADPPRWAGMRREQVSNQQPTARPRFAGLAIDTDNGPARLNALTPMCEEELDSDGSKPIARSAPFYAQFETVHNAERAIHSGTGYTQASYTTPVVGLIPESGVYHPGSDASHEPRTQMHQAQGDLTHLRAMVTDLQASNDDLTRTITSMLYGLQDLKNFPCPVSQSMDEFGSQQPDHHRDPAYLRGMADARALCSAALDRIILRVSEGSLPLTGRDEHLVNYAHYA